MRKKFSESDTLRRASRPWQFRRIVRTRALSLGGRPCAQEQRWGKATLHRPPRRLWLCCAPRVPATGTVLCRASARAVPSAWNAPSQLQLLSIVMERVLNSGITWKISGGPRCSRSLLTELLLSNYFLLFLCLSIPLSLSLSETEMFIL